MVALTEAVTVVVVTGKVAVRFPEVTVTLAGTTAAVLLLVSVTTAPAAGAGAVSVTVPVDGAGPVTEAGFKETPERATPEATVRVELTVTPA